MQDTFRTKGMRKKLVEVLKEKGIKSEEVLQAILEVPRHFFFDSGFLEFAYEDNAFPIGSGQTISQPYTVAFQTELLNIKKGDKVLEIGTGSGYQAAILHKLGAKLFTIERHRSLYQKAKTDLPTWGYRPRFFYGDGYKGLPAFAPFDKIIVTCGAPYVPEALVEQLKPEGIMVIPVGDNDVQKMLYITKDSNGKINTQNTGDFAFVPMLENKE